MEKSAFVIRIIYGHRGIGAGILRAAVVLLKGQNWKVLTYAHALHWRRPAGIVFREKWLRISIHLQSGEQTLPQQYGEPSHRSEAASGRTLCVAVAQNKTHCSLLCSYAKHITCALRNVYGKVNLLPLEQFFPSSQSVNTVLSGIISDVQPEWEYIICIGTATRKKKKKESTTMHKPLCF